MFDKAERVSLELAAIGKGGASLLSAVSLRFLFMSCKDQGLKHELVVETTTIQRLQGDDPGALLVVKKQINPLNKLVTNKSKKSHFNCSANN